MTGNERNVALRADLDCKVSPCLHKIFCRNQERKVNLDLLHCCKQRLSEQKNWGLACNSVDILLKKLEDSEMEKMKEHKKTRPWSES